MQSNNFSIYTQLIVDEARKRGISVTGFPDTNKNLAILEFEGHVEYIRQSVTDKVGAVTFKALLHKFLSYKLLKQHSFPVPKSELVSTYGDAVQFLQKYKRIVIKPTDNTGGSGVTANITSESQIKRAIEEAQQNTHEKMKRFICQEHVEGEDNRVLIIDKQHIFGIKRIPAYVVGNDKDSVEALIIEWNNQLKIKNRTVKVDNRLKSYLSKQGKSLHYIPKNDEKILLGELANAHQGGISIDTTDEICSKVRDMVKEIADVFDIPVLGVDIMSPNIEQEPGKIIELNPHAGLTIHHSPTFGTPRNPSAAIIDMLFPETQSD